MGLGLRLRLRFRPVRLLHPLHLRLSGSGHQPRSRAGLSTCARNPAYRYSQERPKKERKSFTEAVASRREWGSVASLRLYLCHVCRGPRNRLEEAAPAVLVPPLGDGPAV